MILSLRVLNNEAEWILDSQTTEPLGQMPLVVHVVPFEKEEERADISSNRAHGFRRRRAPLAASQNTYRFPQKPLTNFMQIQPVLIKLYLIELIKPDPVRTQ